MLNCRIFKVLSSIIVISILPHFSQNSVNASGVTPDINTILMKSTFKIVGANGKMGTVFILGKPSSSGQEHYVLVTAAHVLEGIDGETATLLLRRKEGHTYIKNPYSLKIRKDGKALWEKHPDVDVAVMYITLPNLIDILLASTELLATDEVLQEYDIYPGRELRVLGFPFGMKSHSSGFPILRIGVIASFPLIPSRELKTFLMDFEVFNGNSGGPVYFHDPDWHKRGSGAVKSPEDVQMIVGLVSKQGFAGINRRLAIAEVVHASLIKETVELLPGKP